MKNFTTFCYQIILWIFSLLAFPYLLYQMIIYKKNRKSFWSKLGLNLPSLLIPNRSVIWIHAVSLGETKAVVTFAQELKKRFPQSFLIFSSTTETGHAEAKRNLACADLHIYLPYDFKFIIKKFIKKYSPHLVILSESDYWFNFLNEAKKNGALIALVNGKISERSTSRFLKFSPFSALLFNLFDHACIQNHLYQERFIKLGIPFERITLTGNMKFDDVYEELSPKEILDWKQKLNIGLTDPIITIGSTHDPEETLLIDVLKKIWKQDSSIKVLFIPRHPERYAEVAKIFDNSHINWINYTDLNASKNPAQLILLNQMGLLRFAYQISTVSLVGGSFSNKVGGHNILEPCWYGKPVIFGPYMHTQVEFVRLVKEHQCGFQLSYEELPKKIMELLNKPKECAALGANGMRMLEEFKGATNKTMSALEPLFKKIKIN